MMCVFHKWSKWEQYKWQGRQMALGFLVPADERGKWFECEEIWQRRRCSKCNKVQEERIK